MSLLLSGLAGGLVATVIMTAFMMMFGDDSPPPTAMFWAQYVGNGQPSEYMMQGMVLHFLYGIGAGLVFGLLGAADIVVMSLDTIGGGVVDGLLFGVVLFVVAAVFWMNIVLDMDAGPRQATMFLFFHLVYGAVLGGFVGAGILV